MPSQSLTPHETDVLRVLSESLVTHSVVTLVADLWRTTDNWQPFDCEPLVSWALESLSDKGFVVYGETRITDYEWVEGHRQGHPTTRNVPAHIRLTTKGWEAAGYPRMFHEAGRRALRGMPGRPGDMTDFKNQPFSALGGPIEKEDFATHQDHYPHHIHDYAMKGEEEMARAYNRVTPEIEGSVLAARTVLGIAASYADVAELANVPERTVKYVETDMPRLRRLSEGDINSAASLKQRIVWTLESVPYVPDIRTFSRILGRADSDHDIVHVLHSLHTQGRVDFKEGRDGDAPTDIHLRTKQSKKKENGVAVAPTKDDNELLAGPVASTVESIPEGVEYTPQNDSYPLLDELLDRERNRQSDDNKAMAYIEAAEAVKNVDPDMATALLQKASALNVTFPSPIEQEYIRYVAAHPAKVSDG